MNKYKLPVSSQLPLLNIVKSMTGAQEFGFLNLHEDNGLLFRDAYPAAWLKIKKAAKDNLISEEEYLHEITDTGYCNKFSTGDGETTFRIPLIEKIGNFYSMIKMYSTLVSDANEPSTSVIEPPEIGQRKRLLDIYIHTTNGNDSNPGTQDVPLLTSSPIQGIINSCQFTYDFVYVHFLNTFTTAISNTDGRATSGLGSYNFFDDKSNLIVDFNNSTFTSAIQKANFALKPANCNSCYWMNFIVTASITNYVFDLNSSNIDCILSNVVFNAGSTINQTDQCACTGTSTNGIKHFFHNVEVKGLKSRGSFAYNPIPFAGGYMHKVKVTNSHLCRYIYSAGNQSTCLLSNIVNGGGNSVQFTDCTCMANTTPFIYLGSVTNTIGTENGGTKRQMNINDWKLFFERFSKFGDLLPPLLA